MSELDTEVRTLSFYVPVIVVAAPVQLPGLREHGPFWSNSSHLAKGLLKRLTLEYLARFPAFGNPTD